MSHTYREFHSTFIVAFSILSDCHYGILEHVFEFFYSIGAYFTAAPSTWFSKYILEPISKYLN